MANFAPLIFNLIDTMKHLTLLFIPLLYLSSCKTNVSSEAENAVAQNETAIQNYISTQKITATKSASGLYYQILKANPNGEKSAVGNSVTFHYTLFLLDAKNTVIDSSSRAKNLPGSTTYGANYNILGLEEALSFLKTGEKAVLLMPNQLAYSYQSNAVIPAYAAMGMNVEILKTRTEEQQIDDYIADKKLQLTEKTTSGLRFIKTTTTTDPLVAQGQTLSVKYTGKRLNDVVFDSGQFNYTVGTTNVIKGFAEGISKMRLGEKATIIFASGLGYGTTGSGTTIPPYSSLVFDIEIVK